MGASRQRLRIVVHDYSGHPGQAQLSRELARRGHRVEHQFSPSYTTGRGAVTRQPGDPESLSFAPVALRRTFARYSPLTRVRQELEYGRAAGRAVVAAGPDVAILSNIPLLAMTLVALRLRRRRIPYVFWHQDIYSEGIAWIARARLGVAGAVLGWVAHRLEGWLLRGAAVVVPISDLFVPALTGWGIRPGAIVVIANWAAIDELPPHPRVNPWSHGHGLTDDPVVLYAGTLGLKHDPGLLADAAAALADEATVVVVSEGRGREFLAAARAERGLANLRLLDFQPYEDLPEVLASADVLLTVLESHASRYSVPSKALSYLCAGRPVVASIAEDNAIAVMLREAGAGLVVPPGDAAALVAAVRGLLADEGRRRDLGRRARAYAERVFDIAAVGDRFEDVLYLALGSAAGPNRR